MTDGRPFVIVTTLERATALLEQLSHEAFGYGPRALLVQEFLRDVERSPIPIQTEEPRVLVGCDSGDEQP